MIRQARARAAAQAVGLDPRYIRRLRWVAKARAVRSVGAPLRRNVRFVLSDPEPANFTYELANEDELVHWLAAASGADPERLRSYIGEAHGDAELTRRLQSATAARPWWSKRAPPLGKRVAWYALARVLEPELIVETGVHDGLGSLVLLRALERNAQAGHEGRLLSFDINPAAGWLVGRHPRWELRIASTTDGLEATLRSAPPLGLFIHDSLHTYEHEHWELQSAAAHLSQRGVLLTDNAHGTTALKDLASELSLRYFQFHERPRGHFYPGGAIGLARR